MAKAATDSKAPAEGSRASADLISAWEREGVRGAMLVFVDNAGIARVKCVPLRALRGASETGVGISVVLGAFTATDDFASVPGYAAPAGDMRLVGDLESAAVLDRGEWLWLAVDQYDQEQEPWPGCQRGFLRRMTQRAEDLGLRVVCGGELEWTAGRLVGEEWRPLHRGPSYGAHVGNDVFDLLARLTGDMERAGIELAQIHPEFGDGKLELSIGPKPPVVAADHSVLARQVVHRTSEQFGFVASFSPLPVPGVGNGAHAHFSLWRGDQNLLYGGGDPLSLAPEGEAFVAGILEQLPAMTAIGSPNRLSYERLKPSSWTGAYACWGHENREAALRLEANVGPRGARSANVEWKAVDTSANPYLVYGALMAAGLDGIERGLRLPEPIVGDPHVATAAERDAAGARRLPETFEDAIDALEGSQLLRSAMGDLLFGSLTATRLREAEVTAGWDTDRLIATYRDRF